MRALDLFAGLGGLEWGAVHSLGWDVDGVESMDAAVTTRAASGLKTVSRDVRDVDIRPGEYDALLGGPPCQPFSATGSGSGRALLGAILHAVATYRTDPYAVSAVTDARSALVLEPLRLILAGLPTYVVLEQVPAVLPVWQAYARELDALGYSTAAGVLNAEEYGVPQTRKRAFLVARRDGALAALPVSTHRRYGGADTAGLRATASMADALGWDPATYTISNYGTSGDPRNRGRRYASEPSATVTSKANRVKVAEPSGAVRSLTLSEALQLQTLPGDLPVSGAVNDRFLQVGNAVPALLALRVLESVTR